MGLSGPHNWTQPFCSPWHSGFCSRAYHGVDIPFTRKRLVTSSCQPLRYCSRCSPRWARPLSRGERASRRRVRPSLTCASLPPGRRLVTASGAADAAPGAHPVPGTQRVRESQQLQDPAPALPSLSLSSAHTELPLDLIQTGKVLLRQATCPIPPGQVDALC